VRSLCVCVHCVCVCVCVWLLGGGGERRVPLPSMMRSAGGATPARARVVVKTSIMLTGCVHTRPAGTCPGHATAAGTRTPPSHVVPYARHRHNSTESKHIVGLTEESTKKKRERDRGT
jgi:hypothetical protein